MLRSLNFDVLHTWRLGLPNILGFSHSSIQNLNVVRRMRLEFPDFVFLVLSKSLSEFLFSTDWRAKHVPTKQAAQLHTESLSIARR